MREYELSGKIKTWVTLISLLLCFGFAGSVWGEKAADKTIDAVNYDLDRVAKQLPGLTPSRKANIKRLLRSLKLAEQRLGGSRNKEHASWKAAKQRLDDYRNQLNNLMAGGAPAPTKQSSAPASPAAPAAPAPSQSKTTAAPGNPKPSTNPQMTSHDISKFKRVYGNYQSMVPQLQKLDPKTLHNTRELNNWRGRFNRMKQDVARFAPFKSEPKVAELEKLVNEAAAHYAQVEKQSLAALASLGDIPAQLKVLLARYDRSKLPKPLDPPYTKERAQAWGKYIQAFAAQSNKDAAWLQMVRNTTDQYKFDVKNALNGTIGHSANNSVKDAVTKTRQNIYQPLQVLNDGRIAHLLKLTPKDTQKIKNNLLGEGKFEGFMEIFRNALGAIETGKIVDQSLGQKPDPNIGQLVQKINSQRTAVENLFVTVLADVRMPKTRSEDKKLLAAAAEVLKRPYNGYSWERMLINYALASKKETRAWWSGSTAIAATYIWDEFEAATAEKVGDKFFIFFNEFHYYTSGDSKTILNKWILKKRFQSSQILKENINK